MKRFSKQVVYFSMFVFLMVCVGIGLSADPVPPEVLGAAQKGLSEMPTGLSAAAGIKAPMVRHGLQVYSAAPVSLLKGNRLSSVLTSTGVWRFVVEREGVPAKLLTVARIEGQWKAVSMGGAQLAVEVTKVMERWPVEQGYSHRFTRIFQARADFIEISSKGKVIGYVPLTASRVAFGMSGGFDPAVLLHSPEIMPRLQNAALDTINEMEEEQ